jgi:hypothetical protein
LYFAYSYMNLLIYLLKLKLKFSNKIQKYVLFMSLYFLYRIPAMNNHRNFALWDSHMTSYILNKIYHDIVLYISTEIRPFQEMKMFDITSRVSLENNKIYIYQQIIPFSFDLTK